MKRAAVYLFSAGLLMAGYVALRGSISIWSDDLHTIADVVTVLLALFVGVVALGYYVNRREI